MVADTDWAFAQYERVRERLPQAGAHGAAARVADLGDLAERFDVFLLDAFGVLNVGDTPIAGAASRVAALQAAGKRVMVLTNGASFPAPVSLAKYRRFGFDFAAKDVISSRDILAAALAQEPKRRWAAMAPTGAQLETLKVEAEMLGDDAGVYERAEGFLLIGSGEWSATRQAMLVQSLKKNPRPVLVGNPDLVAPREDSLSHEPGWYAHEIARETGIDPQFSGKPYGGIFAEAKRRFGNVPAQRVAMVGDTLHTDILGGAAAGFKTVLIEDHGLFRGRDTAPFIAQSGISPDFIAATT
ncbi:MAG: HAD-IIA family hydrolase [Rhodobacteraceae bacterium]|nr:HAD-IIA family hydrolase [Paracoccaceae bacterium]